MPISDTPKKILFITMNDSAAEFENASSVAFMVSEPSYKKLEVKSVTYDSFLFNCVDCRVDVVLCGQRNAEERVEYADQINNKTT
jgi:hypothetical protein